MNLEKIKEIEKIISRYEKVGEIEFTSGNYNESSLLIEKKIPTITTEFCEIGSYGDTVYFTFVIYSDSYHSELIDILKEFSNFEIYGFKSFLDNYDLKNLENEVKKEKYFQINFNYSISQDDKFLSDQYQKIKGILKNKVEIVNQLEIDLTKG
ncbi:MAG: hypothetical protein V1851_02840 [Patescibacteria group bacterium]